MKRGYYAIYQGNEYTSGSLMDGRIILRSTNIDDLKIGFEPCVPFIFRKEKIVCMKYVDRSEVEDYYYLDTYATYAGHRFQILEEKDNKLSIVGLCGDYRVFEKLGMERFDKFSYQKWINKDEAEIEIVKEQL